MIGKLVKFKKIYDDEFDNPGYGIILAMNEDKYEGRMFYCYRIYFLSSRSVREYSCTKELLEIIK